MELPVRIGIIGGAGWLGMAIASALVDAGLSAEEKLTLSYRSQKPSRLAGARWTTDNQMLADNSDVVILSVRPEDWPSIDLNADGKLVISVMAGVTMASIGGKTGTARVVRALPNAAADVASSYTPWFAAPAASAFDRGIVRAVFSACGVEDEVSSEDQLDYLSGLSGTGPAYPALLAAAMIKDATAFGIPSDIASRAAQAILVGAGRLIERDAIAPEETLRTFMDYRGITATGLQTMTASGFDDAVAAGLRAAHAKALRMGG